MELKADAGVGYIGAAVITFAFAVDAPAKAPDLLLLAAALFVIAVLISQTFRFKKTLQRCLPASASPCSACFIWRFLGDS
jgi:hypothetical protein